MAAGKPVIAYGKGGALETVIPLNPLEVKGLEIISDKGSNSGIGLNEKTDNPSKSFAQTGKSQSVLTGVFYYEQSVRAIMDAILLFKQHIADFDPDRIRAHVEPFDRSHFKDHMQQILLSRYEAFRRVHPC